MIHCDIYQTYNSKGFNKGYTYVAHKKSFMESLSLSLSASISKPTFFIFFAHKFDKTLSEN